MAWFWCKMIQFLDCETLGYDWHPDPHQDRGLTLKPVVSFAVCGFSPSSWEFQTADVPHWWDGLSHLQREECSHTPNLFAGWLFTLGSPWVQGMYAGLRHTLEHLRCGALHVSATLIPLIFAWGHPTIRATTTSVMRVSGYLRGAQWLAI